MLTPAERGRAIIDPAKFSTALLNRRLWAKQREIAHSVANNPLTAVKGCHASGKTFVASGLPLWWITRHNKAVAYVLAPTLRQVKTFWGEVIMARQNSNEDLRDALPEPTSTRIEIAPDRYAQGASSSRGVNVQGIHGKNVLLIGDEAPGIEMEIWDAVEGMRAGGNVRMLIQGNPVVPSGYFYDAFTKSRKIWKGITISAFDTPNLMREDGSGVLTEQEILDMSPERLAWTHPILPKPSPLISRSWVKERLILWGPKHPKYLSRVLGEFPSDDPYSVFPLSWLERAQRDPFESELAKAKNVPVQVGIDVAGPGHDETVLYARAGGIVLGMKAWADPDPRGPVLRELSQIKGGKYGRKLGKAVVDIIGIGYNFGLHLADNGFDVYGFQAGGRAIDTEQFANQKAEAHWQLRTYLQDNLISQLSDEETVAQLSTIQYRENSRGKTEIESKPDRNKRGIPGSPDRAEAAIQAFMRVTPRVTGTVLGGAGNLVEISPI